jgi:predicted Rossmann fold nucleotide-binding protein DprA/Smf involved in DNA uptake
VDQKKKKSLTNSWPQKHLELGGWHVSAIGGAGALSAHKLAVICSQRCTPSVILKTYDFARLVRGSGLAIVSGFHSPIEKDCLPILLRGTDPIVIVQAHRLTPSRLPMEWQKAIDAGRLLLLSPFGNKDKRVTKELATERNRFVASISDEVLIPYAAPGSKTDGLFHELVASGKRVYTFESQANTTMISSGAVPIAPDFFSNRPTAPSISA